MRKGFTFIEVMVTLLLICITTITVGNALNTSAKVSKSRDVAIQVQEQNISTIETLKEHVKTRDDIWKMLTNYHSNAVGYNFNTSCDLLAVGKGRVSSIINKDNIENGTVDSDGEYSDMLSSDDVTCGSGYTLVSGNVVSITNSASLLSNSKQILINVRTDSSANLANVKVKYGFKSQTKMFSYGSSYWVIDVTADVITRGIDIMNLSNKTVYVVNCIAIEDGSVLGYAEDDTIVDRLKDKSNDFPSMYKLTVHSEIVNGANSNIDSVDLKKLNANKTDITSYLYLKQ